MGKIFKSEKSDFQCMIRSIWQSGPNRECKLAITDIHRLKDLNDLIKASEKKLAILQKDEKSNFDEVAQEKIILKASIQLADELNEFLLFESLVVGVH